MRYLLDTHTFIWYDNEPARLPTTVRSLFDDEANTILLSLASVWEIQIKLQLGKLNLRAALSQVISEQQAHHIELLPITLSHILALEQLPTHHRDPFDRLLIAQAQVEDIPLLTHDPMFAKYPIHVIW
jgi:PIN domain nuclease of toxin-antitoxin system